MILPGTYWKPKKTCYIHGHYMLEDKKIMVDSVLIGMEEAKVTFEYGMRRITMDAETFRKRFKKYG